MKDISFSDIKPYVRYSKVLCLTEDFSTAAIHAYDVRLTYFFSEGAKIKLDDRLFSPKRGTLFIWQSHTSYSILNDSDAETRVMMINFDYIKTAASENIPPMPTVSVHSYYASSALEDINFTDIQAFNSPIVLEGMQSLEHIFQTMTDEYNAPRQFSADMLSLLMHQVLVTVARKLTVVGGLRPTGLVGRVIEYIQDNYSGDLSNEALGKHFSYHPNYINRVMQKHVGQSLHQYVLTYRISKALELLQTTNLSVTEVAERVGFSSIKHFSQTFKSIYGYSPIHFRE